LERKSRIWKEHFGANTLAFDLFETSRGVPHSFGPTSVDIVLDPVIRHLRVEVPTYGWTFGRVTPVDSIDLAKGIEVVPKRWVDVFAVVLHPGYRMAI
jgi:hypothetical protein